MNQDMLVIDYDPFAMESRVIIIEDGQRASVGVSSDMNQLPKELISYCQQYNLYNVKFHAPVGTFYELKRQLDEEEKNVYGENKIKLEIC